MKQNEDNTTSGHLSLGNRLREARRYLGLTQQAAAEAIGVDPNTVARYEADRIRPSSTALFALAQTYERSVEWFLREGDDDSGGFSIEAYRELFMNEASLALRATGKELSDEAIKSIADYIRFVHAREERERRERQERS